MKSRIDQQIDFLVETDRLKSVERMTSPIREERKENSAEHCWQAILSAIVLQEHSNQKVDMLRVIKMLALHDLAEIDCGDVFHYAKDQAEDLAAREEAASIRITSLLPQDQAAEFMELWREFEARETPEAKYAHSIDRTMAFLMNSQRGGGTWRTHGITREQMVAKNQHSGEGASAIWEKAQNLFDESMKD